MSKKQKHAESLIRHVIHDALHSEALRFTSARGLCVAVMQVLGQQPDTLPGIYRKVREMIEAN